MNLNFSSPRTSRVTGHTVETHNSEFGGWQVTVNRYNGDNDCLQVFIDGVKNIHGTVCIDDLDKFIAEKTRRE